MQNKRERTVLQFVYAGPPVALAQVTTVLVVGAEAVTVLVILIGAKNSSTAVDHSKMHLSQSAVLV